MSDTDGCRCALNRRDLLVYGPAAVAAGMAGAKLAVAQGANPDWPQVGDRLVITEQGELQGKRARPDLMPVGGRIFAALPVNPATGERRDKSRFSKLVLVRLPPDELDQETRANAADGVIAYSAICTHQACAVSGWKEADRTISCFCHHSEFKATTAGSVAGGPATRRLPMLPLKVGDDGELVVAGEFTAKPGIKA